MSETKIIELDSELLEGTGSYCLRSKKVSGICK
ncbi:hypothetical protein J2S17_004791 [Cytobacillus purgationiresistens]|uniref:NERD domain-containing protein n=1 Tax=Cytobacillus purgationiresistens TaxID=863449 RepID=A0ABU0AR66_9BACI|nr:hypothetical protein [Cytobacillus purgationiresistens]